MHTPAPGLGAATVALALIAAPSIALAQAPAPASPPATATPANPAPAASPPAPAAAQKTAPPASTTGKSTPKGAAKPLEPAPLPDTPARLWLIAPGPHEAWTMRIDNDGTRPIRVPADVRLLQFEIEVPSVDPKKKKPDVYKCAAPSSIKPSGFPERRALLLAPGQSYIESFDPRLFCFGKSAAGLVGTALVKTTFGWEPEKKPKWGSKKTKPPVGPFAVESTDNPSATAPVKQLSAPSIVLSFGTQGASEPPSTIAGVDANPPGAPVPGTYRPPPPVKEAPPPPPPAPTVSSLAPGRSAGHGRDVAISRKRLAAQQKEILATTAAPKSDASSTNTDASTAKSDASTATPDANASTTNASPAKNGDATTSAAPAIGTAPANGTTPADGNAPAAPAKIVDQNAPRLVVQTSAFSDASAPASASITVTVKNAGARAMTAAIKPRMISFEVVGPDRTVTCPSWPPTHAIPRESYREYKPNATTSFTLLLDEVCPDITFSRPGLYSVRAGVWANESGDELGVTGFVGRAKAEEATLLRLQSAKDSFYREAPRAVPTPAPKLDDEAVASGDAKPSDAKPSDAKPSDAKPSDAAPAGAAPPASNTPKAPGG